MKKLFAVVALLSTATLAQAGTKLTYMKAQLVAEHADSVPGIVDKYLADTGRTTLINPVKVLFLLNGKPVPSVADKLKKSDRVEVLSNGDSVVINVVTKPARRGT